MTIPVSVQKALTARGLYTGKLDGQMGPLTLRALMAVAAARKSPLDVEWELAKGLWAAFVEAEIDRRLRIIHAVAQACAETAFWQAMTEMGSSAYFTMYDGKYGNGSGDGYCYRGRGFVMLTFRDNYGAASKALGLDLIKNPSQAAQPETAGRVFAWYWNSRHINAYADANDLAGVTRRINGGTNGLGARQTCLNRLAALWPTSTSTAAAAA